LEDWQQLINFSDIDFYFITDSNLTKKSIFSDVENALNAGCKIIQYREKVKNSKKMIEEAKKIKSLCNGKALLIVNDWLDVAIGSDADGLHIGQDDIKFQNARKSLGENKIIGITAHNLKEAIDSEKLGADYIGLAPIFKTETKKDSIAPIGINEIKLVKNNIKIPIVAVGGISKENVSDVINAGADSAAVISAVLKSNNVFKEIKEFCKIIKESKIK
jgi:thiamine-phosphate pyrophosphorylase